MNLFSLALAFFVIGACSASFASERSRVIVTSDGEIDDECSLVRFLLYANEWDIEGIITSSSQYHWQGHKWAGDDWAQPYLKAYAEVHPNLVKHDPRFPDAKFLQARTLLGNTKAEGEMEEVTAGSQRIVEVLLDQSDSRPIWLQAWGGTNTIARALKTIEEEHPSEMARVAKKIRLYLIWEQDKTYQEYVRPHWGKYQIPTIISDQFIAFFYHWKKYLPKKEQSYMVGSWMRANVLESHGPLCSLYKARKAGEKGYDDGDFRSEGDSPAFLHTIPTGLRSTESPNWGGWGGRFVWVRDNTWLDPVSEPGYEYPKGRWYTSSAWGRSRLRKNIPNDEELTDYLKPQSRWIAAIQNDFAGRADWCVKSFEEANHEPKVVLTHGPDINAKASGRVQLGVKATDPDGDKLTYRWWRYHEADTYDGDFAIQSSDKPNASFNVPVDAQNGDTIHIVCEVTDAGSPPITRYQRAVISVR